MKLDNMWKGNECQILGCHDTKYKFGVCKKCYEKYHRSLRPTKGFNTERRI